MVWSHLIYGQGKRREEKETRHPHLDTRSRLTGSPNNLPATAVLET